MMNSSDFDQEQRDAYDQNSYVPLNIQKPKSKTNLKLLLEPIPTHLLFPYSEVLPNGCPIYSNHPLQENQYQTIFLCIHGAGHSAMVYGHLAKQMKNHANIIAYDIMGHGNSEVIVSQTGMMIQAFVEEGLAVFQQINQKFSNSKIILVGHSLGGAIATKMADQLKHKIDGIVMIDTIQGSALKSTQDMLNFLMQRPGSFESIQSAIKWNYKAGCVRRLQSARFSIPSMFFKNSQQRFEWKVNLLKNTYLWSQWYKGISQTFNQLKCENKYLFTTCKFRLDEILLSGLAQDKYKLQLFSYSGHNIHQDEYEKVARILISNFIQQQ